MTRWKNETTGGIKKQYTEKGNEVNYIKPHCMLVKYANSYEREKKNPVLRRFKGYSKKVSKKESGWVYDPPPSISTKKGKGKAQKASEGEERWEA